MTPALAAAEQRAREFLGQAKWRKARDELKPLVKADRARYLPLLIEANLGLAREMITKGQTEEARQVLAYLGTIAPAQQLVSLEAEVAARSGKSGGFTAKFASALADGAAGLPQGERLRLADQLVLAFEPVPDKPGLGGELRAVHEALRAACEQQWAKAAELLRSVPHRSSFSHWAAFLKGVAAFHNGERERAERFFSGLPATSVPAKASLAYRILGRPANPSNAVPEPTEAALDGACHLAGLVGVGRWLLTADRLWKQGRYADSYRVFRDGVAQFPGDGLDWVGSLSDFYFQAPFAMSEAQRDPYMGYLDGLLHRKAAKSQIEEMRILRLFSLLEQQVMSGWDLRMDWEGFIQAHRQTYGPNPRLESLAYGWLGEQLSRPRAGSYFGPGGPEPRLRDAAGARDCLEKAIQLDPRNLEAHLLLAAVYGILNRNSERNRLLDKMAREFPQEKPVLVQNAQGCIARKAYNKALTLLESARRLDRLDPQIPEQIVVARRRLARQQYEQHQLEKARQSLAPIEEFLTDKPQDFQRSRWTAFLRQGLMERLFGESERAGALLAQARAASPFPAAFLFFAHLTYRVYARPPRSDSPFLPELRTELKRAPSAANGVLLMLMFHYWDQAPDRPPLEGEVALLRNYLQSAAKRACTRAEAKSVVELCSQMQFKDSAARFVKVMLKQDPGDPSFRLFDYYLKSPWELGPEEKEEWLGQILEEAQRRGDQEMIQKLQGMVRSLHHPPPVPAGPEAMDFEDEEDFDDAGGGLPEAMLPPMAAADQDLFAEMLEMLANASEADVQRLRKTKPKDMPDFMFDMLLAAAKGKGPLPGPLEPAPPKTPKPPQPKPAAPQDPNQGQLF